MNDIRTTRRKSKSSMYYPTKFGDGSAYGSNGSVKASAVSYIPSSTIAATNVQSAIDQIDQNSVFGSVASTNNGVARWDGITGRQLKDSSVLISDTGDVKAVSSTLVEGVAPAAPTLGEVVVYAKTDGFIYTKASNGAETKLGGSGTYSSWLFSTAITGVVSDGVFRFDSVSSASSLVISVNNKDGNSMRPILQQLNMGDTILMSDVGNTNIKLYRVDDSVDNTSEFDLTVGLVSQTSTSNYTDGATINMTLAVSGNPFDQSLNTNNAPSFTDLTLTNSGLTIQPAVGDPAELKLNGGAMTLRNNTVGGTLTMINNNHEITIGADTLTGSGTKSLSLLNTSPTQPTST